MSVEWTPLDDIGRSQAARGCPARRPGDEMSAGLDIRNDWTCQHCGARVGGFHRREFALPAPGDLRHTMSLPQKSPSLSCQNGHESEMPTGAYWPLSDAEMREMQA